MNLNKHLEFLSPSDYKRQIHIIGVGAVGSRIAEQLTRLGFSNFNIYDFDTVDDINIPNQLYVHKDIGSDKVDAMKQHMLDINPNVQVRVHAKGYTNQSLMGAVFLAVDSIDLRRKIVSSLMYSDKVDVVFDGRMRLTDAQYYGANWKSEDHRKTLLDSMTFTDEQAESATPVSACGSSLSVVPTVVTLSSVIVANFISYVKKKDIFQMALIDPFESILDGFKF